MKRPIPADLLDWFRAYVQEHKYLGTEDATGLSPVTIAGTLSTGRASAGTIARIVALRGGTLQAPETLALRESVARIHAARVIAVAAEAFPPDRQRLILDSLGPEVLETMAIRDGALLPRGEKRPRKS